MNHIETSADRATELATERLHDEMHEGEPAGPQYREIDLATFSDAPYDFICPDGEGEEHDAQVEQLFDALKMVMDHQEVTSMIRNGLSQDRAVALAFRLARLGAAVQRIAKSRGLEHRFDKLVQEVEQ